MAELINLRQFKKRKARQEDADRAAENRAKFGRAKTQKSEEAAAADKARRDHDGKKRE